MIKMKKYIPSKYWNERLKNNFNLKGVGNFGYPLIYNELVYLFKRRILKKYLEKIETESVLDIGCETGAFIKIFKKNGVQKYFGMDISKESIKRLSKLYDYPFIIGDISNFFLKKKFDIINCFDILIHIKNDKKFKNALKNISQMSNGFIFFTDTFDGSEKWHVKNRKLEKYSENLPDFALVNLKKIPLDLGVKFAVFEKIRK